MKPSLRTIFSILVLVAACAWTPAPAFAADLTPEAPPAVPAEVTPDAPAVTPDPSRSPSVLDDAIATSGSLGDCWVQCGSIDPYWIYGVTYEYCCGQGHACPDGSTGYARGFWPYQGYAVRCAL